MSWQKFKNWFFEGPFGPMHRVPFTFRVRMRVRWLRAKHWMAQISWRQWSRDFLPRPVFVAIAFAVPLVLSAWFEVPLHEAWSRLKGLLDGGTGSDPLSWQTALILVGIPVAYVLWIFRDINARKNLDNQRKDINLKEFQEIQLRATGALDENLPEKARETLQIAAIHQLRPFLSGEFGESFRRPAWEILRARLVDSAEAIKIAARALVDQLSTGLTYNHAPQELLVDASGIRRQIQTSAGTMKARPSPGAVADAEQNLLQEEWSPIFRAKLPLEGSCFDAFRAPKVSFFSGLVLNRSSFIAADLADAHFEFAQLVEVHLEGAWMMDAHLEGANLLNAKLTGATLQKAHLEGADLRFVVAPAADFTLGQMQRCDLRNADLRASSFHNTNLQGANLTGAELQGSSLTHADLRNACFKVAELRGAQLDGAKAQGADFTNCDPANLASCARMRFDDNTKFAAEWHNLDGHEKEECRQRWREAGAIHVNDRRLRNIAS